METGLIKNRIEDLQSVEPPEGISALEIKFALNTLQGYHQVAAYRRAAGSAVNGVSKQNICNRASKLKGKPLVKQYLKALVQELERVAVANALDLQMFLSAAIFTPVGDINEHHPLCQKKKTTIRTDKDGATTETTDYESVSKMDAAKTLIRMKGLDAPIRVDHTHRVGVMVVPMAASVEDWESAAMASQKKLMDEAIDV